MYRYAVHFLVIKSFRHRGLRRLFYENDHGGVSPTMANRIMRCLNYLDAAARPSDLNLPGLRLHRLRGTWKGYWSIRVTGNWRIFFRLEEGNVYGVNLVDYH